jgi:hypothetical protein
LLLRILLKRIDAAYKAQAITFKKVGSKVCFLRVLNALEALAKFCKMRFLTTSHSIVTIFGVSLQPSTSPVHFLEY